MFPPKEQENAVTDSLANDKKELKKVSFNDDYTEIALLKNENMLRAKSMQNFDERVSYEAIQVKSRESGDMSGCSSSNIFKKTHDDSWRNFLQPIKIAPFEN